MATQVNGWDESEHPRHPAGSEVGGRFRRGGFPGLSQVERVAAQVGSFDWVTRLSERMVPPYRPGNWTRLSSDEDMEKVHAEREAEVVGLFIKDGMPRITAVREARDMFLNIDPPYEVWRNGPHELSIETPQSIPAAELLRELDDLQTRYPVRGQIRLSVVERSEIRARGITAVAGTGVVMLADTAFNPPVGTDNLAGGVAMAAGRQMETWYYAMAHEWGHVIDQQGEDPNRPEAVRAQELAFDQVDMSEYGRSNRWEAHAEAFAEWYLSDGQTRNKLVRQYAKEMGW